MTAHVNGFVTNLTGGLSRLMCDGCAEETIHRGITCIRCGGTHKAYPVRAIFTRGISVSPRTKRRGVAVRNYPMVLPGSRPAKVVAK